MPSPLFSDPGPAGRLGRLVRHARIAMGLRQEDVARRCEIATATLRRIETGQGTGPSVFVVVRLFRELGLELGRLDELITPPPSGEPREERP
ncbi:helix-turn-helix domain-containing protein [uncultured Frigoribacterium sp.]|uniref:helix-turn-helix domain-containing protein n=1 Tax=uncultured Frigoribacterium sp. TaxID=335377 RepID=UPI0037DD6E9B